jgi:hypothetical protein
MSAEIILLNKLGVAIAADSAITVGNRAAIFNTAQKIFSFGEKVPLAFLYYSATDFMGIPIDVIFLRYMESVHTRKLQLNTIREYLHDFVQFIEKNGDYFTFQEFENKYLTLFFYERYKEYTQKREELVEQQTAPVTESNIIRDTFVALNNDLKSKNHYQKKLQYEPTKILNKKTLNPLIKSFLQIEVFGRDNNNEQLLNEEEEILFDYFSGFVSECFQWVFAYEKVWQTSVYLVGYGQDSLFPSYGGINLFCFLKGRLIYNEGDFGEVSQAKPGLYITLAQDDAIESFLNGLNFDSLFQIEKDLNNYIRLEMQKQKDIHNGDTTFIEKLENLILKGVEDILYNSEHRRQSELNIRASLANMGLLDLADYAENLINLQTIRRKYELSSQNQATVGGPTNVAIIDKYTGFRWYKVTHR